MSEDHYRVRRRALLAALGGGAVLSTALQRALAQTSFARGVHSTQGEVRVNDKPAARGTPVRPGDTVTTGKGALTLFVIGQDAFFMRDNSQAEFSGRETVANALRLVTGKLLGVFGGGDHSIVTATATIGLRGTAAYLEAEAVRTYFCLCYGTAVVAAAGSDQRANYTTTHHESPRYIYGDSRAGAIVPASVVNHTDAEIFMLEGLVDRRPPQSFMDGEYMNSPYR
jgi:hypothetical protein